MTFCKECGKELPSKARFCPACGSPVADFATAPTQSHRTFTVAAKPRVVVTTLVPGMVEVKVGSAGAVDVDLDLRRSEDMDWNVYQQGDLITVSFRTTSRTYWSWASHLESGPRADIVLSVPKECDLDLENRLDRVSILGVQGVIIVNSVVAGIEAKGCGGNLKVRTKTGSIMLYDVNGSVFAETATGQIMYSGCLAKTENWFHTSVGTIQLSLKGELDLSVEAHSGLGDVSCTLPLVDARNERGMVRGRLGAGSGRLRAETGTGSILIGS